MTSLWRKLTLWRQRRRKEDDLREELQFQFAADDRAGAAPVAVLSFGYSERRFGSAAAAIGQPILVNNVPFSVIGVAPAGSSV